MKNFHLAFTSAALASLLLSGCGDECVRDNDCAFGMYCGAGECVQRATQEIPDFSVDASVSEDAAVDAHSDGMDLSGPDMAVEISERLNVALYSGATVPAGRITANWRHVGQCTVLEEFGECDISGCDPIEETVVPDAGTITLSIDGAISTLDPDETGRYNQVDSDTPPWTSEVPLNVSLGGNALPAAMFEEMTTHSQISVEMSRNSDGSISVTWGLPDLPMRRTPPMKIRISGVGHSESARGAQGNCTFELAGGAATIPAELLARFESYRAEAYFMTEQRQQEGSVEYILRAGTVHDSLAYPLELEPVEPIEPSE